MNRLMGAAGAKMLIAGAALSFVAMPASAAFFDGFEGETAGPSIIDYDGFTNWAVTNDTVDLIRTGEFNITCRTGNYCLDLKSNTGVPQDAGAVETIASFDFEAGNFVEIVFWASGNTRNRSADANVVFIGAFSGSTDLSNFALSGAWSFGPSDFDGIVSFSNPTGSIAPDTPFQEYRTSFTVGNAGSLRIGFSTFGGFTPGAILDDVSITITPGTPAGVIPEPATWAMLIAGFGLTGAALRRRRGILRPGPDPALAAVRAGHTLVQEESS